MLAAREVVEAEETTGGGGEGVSDHDPLEAESRRESIVPPVRRSKAGETKVSRQRAEGGEPAWSFETLMADLGRSLTVPISKLFWDSELHGRGSALALRLGSS